MKVSIITVSYNSSKTLENTFLSVKGQTYKNIEYIIVDGASKDNTLLIVDKYRDILNVVISEPDNGLYYAMNKGIKKATGDIVAILNSDDTFKNEYVIETIVDEFKKNNSDMIYGNIDYRNEDKNLVRFWKSNHYEKGAFINGWHPPHPALFIKREVYTKHGVFDTNFKIAADFDLMLRFFEINNISNTYINLTTTSMLIGGASSSLSGITRGIKEILNSFKKYNLKPSWFYIFNRYLSKIKQKLNKN